MNKNVLIADNDADFLETRVEALRDAGYRVYTAASVDDAEKVLRNIWIHVAVIDIRLEDDNNARDTSGLALAKKEAYRAVPKVILTAWPSYQAVREVMAPSPEGLPPAVDFVGKQEGVEAMLQAVATAFQRQTGIDWDLSIQNRDESATFLYLISLIDPSLSDEDKLGRAEELEGLFRALFQRDGRISFGQVLWRAGHRVALIVSVFSENRKPESLVVVCGTVPDMADESRCYQSFAPKAPGHSSTVLTRSSGTLHYSTNAYALNCDVETLKSLEDLYATGSEKSFSNALSNLFESTLVEWHQRKSVPSAAKSLQDHYRDRLFSKQAPLTQAAVSERVQSIVRKLPSLNVHAELQSGELTLRFGGLSFSYPDPAPFFHEVPEFGAPVVLMTTPGLLTGENVLVDENGSTWLTDFAEAGLAPVLWHYVQVESAIRFDWAGCNRLQWLHEMEQCLIEGDFAKFNIGDVEQPLRKPLRAIQGIRRLAAEIVGADPLSYHLGIFYHAIKRISDFNPDFQLTLSELAKLGHALIAAAMITDQVSAAERGDRADQTEERGVRVDTANHRVWVNGRSISLSRQSYELLCALYEKPDQFLTRGELGVRIFGEKYDETEPSHVNRLNTAIFRLRERIEVDPKHPRLLLTEPSGGYRLAASK